MQNEPKAKTTEQNEDQFTQFTGFMRTLVSVPHSTIKARMEAEKKTKRTTKPSSSRAAGA